VPDRYTAELIIALAASVPRLPEARCRQAEARDTFDAAVTMRDGPQAMRRARARAQQYCADCPALLPCRRWLRTLADPPRGVIAGVIIAVDDHPRGARYPDRTCLCGTTFTPRRKDQRCCSPACQRIRRKREDAARYLQKVGA
jgi:hypothetical protein